MVHGRDLPCEREFARWNGKGLTAAAQALLSGLRVNGDRMGEAAWDVSGDALKKCEHRDTLVLRLYNPTLKDFDADIKFFRPIKEVWLTNMNEERREKLPVNDNIVSIHFGHKKIVTCEVILER